MPANATLAQAAEQTLRKRQVKGSSPLGGLVLSGGPQQRLAIRIRLGPLLCTWTESRARGTPCNDWSDSIFEGNSPFEFQPLKAKLGPAEPSVALLRRA